MDCRLNKAALALPRRTICEWIADVAGTPMVTYDRNLSGTRTLWILTVLLSLGMRNHCVSLPQ